MSDAHPVIGVTTYIEPISSAVWNLDAAYLPTDYLAPLVEAGAVPVLLPPRGGTAEAAAAALDRVDALIVSGGYDVDPALYGQEPHPDTDEPRPNRDRWESALIREAIRRGLPLFGICRGAQLLNVVLGGSLTQHVPDRVGHERYQPGGGVFGTVDVTIEPGTLTADVLGDVVHAAPVYHHQAIDRVADGLVVSARSADGLPEAVELPGADFCVGVQWHPERLAEERALFDRLVVAAQTYRDAR